LRRRIGLLGGTFDPIHFGHLQLAELAMRQCSLAKVLFIPAAAPPHKTDRAITAFTHRVKMISLALAATPGFQLTSLEGDLPSPSYTIDTLLYLAEKHAPDDEFYFILGADAFLEINTWKSCAELLARTHFIVAGRSGYSPGAFESFAASLGYARRGEAWFHSSGNTKLFYLPEATDDISSSAVRSRIARRDSLEGLVPRDVIHYIDTNNLYALPPSG
jgi:nicotinate-nucleotide adenylyltransferase